MVLSGQEARVKKAEALIKAAQFLFENGYYNDCVSRAYYAVYHAIIAVLVVKRNVIRDKWDHKELHVAFLSNFCSKGYLFNINDGKILSTLMSKRFEADYDMSILNKKSSEKHIKQAAVLIVKIKGVLNA